MKRLFLVAATIALCAPAENLEHVDVALIDTAKREIDRAAYVLTDGPVIQALTRAADPFIGSLTISFSLMTMTRSHP